MSYSLATPESIFHAFFWPLYPPDAQADLASARTTDANPAKNPGLAMHLDEAARIFADRARALFEADLALDFTDASIHRLSAAITRARRDAWAARGAAGTPENELFNVVVHGSAYVGACIVRSHGASWAIRRPLWESLVHLTSRLGEADLAIFHWWLKSLSDAQFDRETTLADRYRAHVENACARPEDLPIVAPPDRALPRLLKPRYDTLYKYMKAHLPELRDLGGHFPSPERFEELAFQSIEPAWLGGGRMLLLSGINKHGVHLFWLDAGGFVKSAFYPSEKSPAPSVQIEGDKIVVTTSMPASRAPVVHEMLWWGP